MTPYPERVRHSSGTWMNLDRSRLLVGIRPKGAAATVLRSLGLEPELEGHPGASREQRPARLNNAATRVWAHTSNGQAYDHDRISAALRAGSGPAWVAPVYQLEIEGRVELLSVLPHVLLVEPNRDLTAKALKALLDKNRLVEDAKRSRYLGTLRYCRVGEPDKSHALDLQVALAKQPGIRAVRLETIPMFVPTAYVPNDTLYPDQWDMTQIGAGGSGQTGWNLQRGDPTVIVCILDEGCDLGHPDLRFTAAPSGINLGTMTPDGSPTGPHGTACAGIAAGMINNGLGVAGVAGGCTVLPLAFDTWSDVEVAAGIRYAADNGARVISMSFGWNAWDHAIIDPAIQYGFDANVVMCVATHNYKLKHHLSRHQPAGDGLRRIRSDRPTEVALEPGRGTLGIQLRAGDIGGCTRRVVSEHRLDRHRHKWQSERLRRR